MRKDPGSKASSVSLCQMVPLPLDLESGKDSPPELAGLLFLDDLHLPHNHLTKQPADYRML